MELWAPLRIGGPVGPAKIEDTYAVNGELSCDSGSPTHILNRLNHKLGLITLDKVATLGRESNCTTLVHSSTERNHAGGAGDRGSACRKRAPRHDKPGLRSAGGAWLNDPVNNVGAEFSPLYN